MRPLFLLLVLAAGVGWSCAEDEAPASSKTKKKPSSDDADDDDSDDDDDPKSDCKDAFGRAFDVTFDATAAVRMRATAVGSTGFALAWAAEPYVGSEIYMGKRARFGLFDGEGRPLAKAIDALAKPSFAPLSIARGDGATALLLRTRPNFDQGDRKESVYFALVNDGGKLVRAPSALAGGPAYAPNAIAIATGGGHIALWAIAATETAKTAHLYAQAFGPNGAARSAALTVEEAASPSFTAAVNPETEQIAVTWYDTDTWIRLGSPEGFNANTVKVALPSGKNGANGKALFATGHSDGGFVLVLVDDGVATVTKLDDHGVAKTPKIVRIDSSTDAPIRFARWRESTFVVWQTNASLTPLGEGDATDEIHALQLTDDGEAIGTRLVGTITMTNEERQAASNAVGVDLGEPVVDASGVLRLPVTRTTFTTTSVHVASICPAP